MVITECQRINAFELWWWRLLRVPWNAGRSNQSILKEISPEYTLATWCKEPTHWKKSWCWERLRAEGEVGDRGWDGWMASLNQQTWVWANSGRWWRTEEPGVLQSMGLQRIRHDLVIEQQQQLTSEATHQGIKRWKEVSIFCSSLCLCNINFKWNCTDSSPSASSLCRVKTCWAHWNRISRYNW